MRARGQGNTVSAANAAIGGGNTNRHEDDASNGEREHCNNPYQRCRERRGLNEILDCARHDREFRIEFEFELEIWESQRLGGSESVSSPWYSVVRWDFTCSVQIWFSFTDSSLWNSSPRRQFENVNERVNVR